MLVLILFSLRYNAGFNNVGFNVGINVGFNVDINVGFNVCINVGFNVRLPQV